MDTQVVFIFGALVVILVLIGLWDRSKKKQHKQENDAIIESRGDSPVLLFSRDVFSEVIVNGTQAPEGVYVALLNVGENVVTAMLLKSSGQALGRNFGAVGSLVGSAVDAARANITEIHIDAEKAQIYRLRVEKNQIVYRLEETSQTA